MIELLDRCVQVHVSFELQRRQVVLMDRYAVRYRYPGESADKAEARLAVKTAAVVPAFAREQPGLAR